MTSVVIDQPNYIPWIGHFDLMSRADVWVWYDDVQYTRRDWRNRNLILLEGRPIWLSIPVRTRGRFTQRIADVEIDHSDDWVRRHLATFAQGYSRQPYYAVTSDLLASHLERRPRLLADLTIPLSEAIAGLLGIRTRFLRASALGVGGDRQGRLIALCRSLGADTYVSGPTARAYIDPGLFARAGIHLLYMTYGYPATGAHSVRPGDMSVSILDTIARLGADRTGACLGLTRLEPPRDAAEMERPADDGGASSGVGDVED